MPGPLNELTAVGALPAFAPTVYVARRPGVGRVGRPDRVRQAPEPK